MSRRMIFNWALAIAVALAVTWRQSESVHGLESKIVYQRQLINELKGAIDEFREESERAIDGLKAEIRAQRNEIRVIQEIDGHASR